MKKALEDIELSYHILDKLAYEKFNRVGRLWATERLTSDKKDCLIPFCLQYSIHPELVIRACAGYSLCKPSRGEEAWSFA
jgi:hypothetical protein